MQNLTEPRKKKRGRPRKNPVPSPPNKVKSAFIEEAMADDTRVDRTNNFHLGEKSVLALSILVKHWMRYQSMSQICRDANLSRQLAYNWKDGKAKMFSQSRLSTLSQALECPENLLKLFLVDKINIDQLWAKTKFATLSPDIELPLTWEDDRLTLGVDKPSQELNSLSIDLDAITKPNYNPTYPEQMSSPTIKNALKTEEQDNILFTDVKDADLLNILITLSKLNNNNTSEVNNMILEALLRYIQRLTQDEKKTLLNQLLRSLPDYKLNTTVSPYQKLAFVTFSSPKEIEIAKEIINFTKQYHQQNNNYTDAQMLNWFTERGVPAILLDHFFNPDRDSVYLCNKSWDPIQFSKLTDTIFPFVQLHYINNSVQVEIDFNSTYTGDMDLFFYHVRKLAKNTTPLSDMINKCIMDNSIDQYHINSIIEPLGMNINRWHQLRIGEKQACLEEINIIVSVCDINYSSFSRQQWTEQANQCDLHDQDIDCEHPDNFFPPSNSFLQAVA